MSRGNKSSKHCVECEKGVGFDHLSRAFSSVTQICNFYSYEWNQISSLNLMKGMENTQKWFEFISSAHEILLLGQEIDNYKPTIQIAIEPSFDKSIFFQLVINEEKTYWYRTIWERLIDAPKFSNTIESLGYVGQPIKPTIIYEKGIIETNKLIK